MYLSFFGLDHEPFSIAPDPRFLYLSDKHREALALLGYGLNRGASFVLLTGEIGAGKTTVWRRFLEELPSNFDVANVVNPKLDTQALIARIVEDLHLEAPPAQAPIDMIDALQGHLLLAHGMGRRTLIVIDEAQALSSEVLEQLRLLTNLDSSGRKLQVMLIGQPELRQMLQQPRLEPLAQRVVARYHLSALSEHETAGYIAHRLAVAGLKGAVPFDGESIGLVHRLCGGVPRRINVVCDRAMAHAMSAGTRRIDRHVVERAMGDVYGDVPLPEPRAAASPRSSRVGTAVAVGAAALAAGVLLGPQIETLWSTTVGTWLPAGRATPRASAEAARATVAEAPAAGAGPFASPSPAVAAAPSGTTASSMAPAAASVTPAPTLAGVSTLPALPGATAGLMATTALPGKQTATGLTADALFTAAAADEAPALRTLAALWGTTLGGGDPCTAAATKSLRCLRTRGGIAMIRQIDRPGVLRLVDDRGRIAHALLTGAGPDRATLNAAGIDVSVPLVDLARVWRGDFVTLWRAPPVYREGDVASSTAEGTAWIAERLATIDGRTGQAAGKDALRARIAAFQLAHGLTPDGLAGPLTMMQLARASQDDEPRLTR